MRYYIQFIFEAKGHPDLQNRISASKEASSISNETVAELSAQFTKVTKDLADAVGSLPAYDQKGYENVGGHPFCQARR